MAELLVKLIDAIHLDSIKDQRGCYKSGDVVAVMPDDHVWGNAETFPVFFIVKVPEMSVEEASSKYLQPEYSTTEFDKIGRPLITSRRAYKLDKQRLPINQKDITSPITITSVELNDCEVYKPDTRR